jgi:uncharacterized membrane protein
MISRTDSVYSPQQPSYPAMKILKIILIGIVSLITLILIVALFVKKSYTVERQITINKPKTTIFEYVKILRNSENYSKWVMADPSMKKESKGVDGTRGFIFTWNSESDEVGEGEQEIISIAQGDSSQAAEIEYELRFIRPFSGKAQSVMTLIPSGAEQTRVKWHFASEMIYPMNIMLLFMNMEDFLGKDLDTTLQNLKQILEKQ